MTTALDNQVNSKITNAFNFEIARLPLYGPEGIRTPCYGLFRSDNGNFVGDAVTARYEPHQTADIIALADAASEAMGGLCDAQCYFRNGHYLTLEPTKEYRMSVYGTKDNIFPRLMITAGYNGQAFRASMGYYRDLCRNMARLDTINQTSVAIRHTSSLRSRMDELIGEFTVLKNSWGNLTDTVANLESRNVNMVDFLDQIYGQPEPDASQREVTLHRNRTEAIFRRLNREIVLTGRPEPTKGNGWQVSAWEAFNVIQGYSQHDATRRGETNRSSYGRILKAMDDPAVHKAEELVLSL